ncbi:CvfB family protein [Marinomonas atlantica]|uniref:CvfB family protein n=1 Tax=Marinomonas atlantica TaxID=1806668 RepID=UPI000837509E|nr:S1-like domain-containing RNA-binding protein [Marinomonas atlantica]MCO4784622.1 GntR family transcriptional regulator [Marinomonas atlantica]
MPTNIGRMNCLRVVKEKDFGVYLDAEQLGEILLPKRYVPNGLRVGDDVDVFVYLDSEDELIATTLVPKVQVGEFAALRAIAVNQVGAFFDWGLAKDLLVPFSQQKTRVEEGQVHLLFVYLDQITNRIVATTKVDPLLNRQEPEYRTGEQVDIIVGDRTDIGYKCIIDSRYWGVLFFQDLVGRVYKGDHMKAYIKRVREDGKIDLSLQQTGYKKVVTILDQIMEHLEKNEGEMHLTDKSAPDEIFKEFKVSKATFKKALGALYKDQKINLGKDKITLKK